jgi:hypothetical protein
MCEELQSLKHEAVRVFRFVKRIRRSRDISFYEDAELNREKHRSLNAVLKHLLAGHGGKPCPAGGRPIVSLAPRGGWPNTHELLRQPERIRTMVYKGISYLGLPGFPR